VVNVNDRTVVKIDPAQNRVVGKPVPLGGEPSAIAVGDGSVWVTDVFAGTLKRIDPDGMSIEDEVRVGTQPASVAFGYGSLWVAVARGNELIRVEP
jgi:DNA-binding beta-propeller fold protein YncE